jgi:hypothetical protein
MRSTSCAWACVRADGSRLRQAQYPLSGDTQRAAEPDDRVAGLLAFDELVCGHRSELVSCAKKAAAFFRISRSSRKIRFSRRNRRSSSCSSVVRPSLRCPSSSSACFTHSRNVSPVKPSSRARHGRVACHSCAPAGSLPHETPADTAQHALPASSCEHLLGSSTPKPTGVHHTGSTSFPACTVSAIGWRSSYTRLQARNANESGVRLKCHAIVRWQDGMKWISFPLRTARAALGDHLHSHFRLSRRMRIGNWSLSRPPPALLL